MNRILAFLLVIVIAVIGAGIYFRHEVFRGIEGTPPAIAMQSEIKGVGGDPVQLQFTVSDEGAGLREVKVYAEQGDQRKELLTKTYDQPTSTDTVTVPVAARALGLKEGTVKIVIEASDLSLRSNSSSNAIEAPVDFTKPQLEILSLQHVAAQGGVEYVVYRINKKDLAREGVQVGDLFFKGYPASSADPELASHPEIRGALFAIPLGFQGKIEVVAQDNHGNQAHSPLSFRITPTHQAQVQSKLSEPFLHKVVPDLLPKYAEMSGKAIQVDESSVPAMVGEFRTINEDFRRLLGEKLTKVLSVTEPTRLWHEVFIKPVPSATTSTFGEQRHYALGTLDGGGSLHNGLDLASVANDTVKAVNDGVVRYVGDLGIYGNAVLIDHGLGLSSLYAHLSATLVNEGQRVTRGEPIARTGQTGLAGGDHLHFEFRLGNTSVNPIEWWDAKWIKDNIDGKLEGVKNTLEPAPTPAAAAH